MVEGQEDPARAEHVAARKKNRSGIRQVVEHLEHTDSVELAILEQTRPHHVTDEAGANRRISTLDRRAARLYAADGLVPPLACLLEEESVATAHFQERSPMTAQTLRPRQVSPVRSSKAADLGRIVEAALRIESAEGLRVEHWVRPDEPAT
jgi:hypothetical protein